MKNLLARHAASSMLKQLTLDDLVGEASWQADLDAGTLRFGGGPPHPVQLLGTEAHSDRTWLWSWANTVSDLPPAVTRAAERLRALGQARGIAELSTRKLAIGEASGHTLSMIASGSLGAGSYYRGPYEGGAAFFLLPDYPGPEQLDRSALRLIRAVELVISQYELDHRAVVTGLAEDLRLRVAAGPKAITVTSPTGEEVVFELDAQGRIARMSSRIRPR